ncbi:MAG: family transporter [Bacteroidota bacterium]|nr:family transporter [Bacteroidota bacterium]
MTEPIKLPFYIKATVILIGAIAFLYLLFIGGTVILPLIFALFISILINPVVNFLVKRKVPRVIAIGLALLLTIIVLAGLMFFLSLQISMFSHTYPQLKAKFEETSGGALTWVSTKFNIDQEAINQWVNNTKDETAKALTGNMGKTLLSLGSAMVAIILVPVYIFLILFYKPLLLEFIRKLFKVEHHKDVADVLGSVNTIINSYLRGLLIEGAIVAVLNSIALLAIGVEYAILLGITGAILNVIPYIGGITAIVLPMVVAFVTKSLLSAVLVLGAYLLIQFIDNHYLIPYIVASKVKINALVCIVVVLIGDLLWGVPGMFLSIPLTALVKVIFDHIGPLKPWGFLLGDTIPTVVRFPFAKRTPAKDIKV